MGYRKLQKIEFWAILLGALGGLGAQAQQSIYPKMPLGRSGSSSIRSTQEASSIKMVPRLQGDNSILNIPYLQVASSRLEDTAMNRSPFYDGGLTSSPSRAVESNLAQEDAPEKMSAQQRQYQIEHPGGRPIENLNLRGGYLIMLPFSQTLDGAGNPVRQFLAKRGIGLMRFGDTDFTYNTLTPPVANGKQTYTGQRPTWKTSHYFFASWDLRQLGVHGGQLYAIGALQKISWNAGGPNAFQFGALAYYQQLFKDHLEVVGGYIDNDLNYVGTIVGGQASSSALGVYASLPFEVGMSYLPMTTPAINLKANYEKFWYTRVGFQRSMDPNGGPVNSRRDSVGLRFIPKGDKLLTIGEQGYRRPASASKMETWLRFGGMYNTTHFNDLKRGGKCNDNYMGYVLYDRQLWKPDRSMPFRGLYAGGSAMYAPPKQNPYTQYYELRLYTMGLFASRPSDMITVVASHTAYSPYIKRKEIALGQTYWNSATSITGSYNFRVVRGLFFSTGLGYTNGPAIAPRAKSSLNLIAQINLFL